MTNIQCQNQKDPMTNRQKREKTMYGEILDVICNSFLLYNSRAVLARETEYSSLNNYKPLSYIKNPVKQEMLYLWLCEKERNRLEDYAFDLRAFVFVYKLTSQFYMAHLYRSRVLNSGKPEALFDMLDYCFGLKSGDAISYYVRRACDNIKSAKELSSKRRTTIKDIRSADISLLILMILGCIPPYNSQKGVGNKKHYLRVQRQVDICNEYSKISSFYNGYIKHGKILEEVPFSVFDLSWDDIEEEFDIHRVWLWYHFKQSLMNYISLALKAQVKTNTINAPIPKDTISKIASGIYCITEKYVEVYTNHESEHYRIPTDYDSALSKLTIKSPAYVYSFLSIQQIEFPSIQLSIYVPEALRSHSIHRVGLEEDKYKVIVDSQNKE